MSWEAVRGQHLLISASEAQMSDGDASQDGELNIFEAPEGYYPPEKQPTSASYRTLSGVELHLRLIGHSPLWVGLDFFHPQSSSSPLERKEKLLRRESQLDVTDNNKLTQHRATSSGTPAALSPHTSNNTPKPS